jgi:hypothetical protein
MERHRSTRRFDEGGFGDQCTHTVLHLHFQVCVTLRIRTGIVSQPLGIASSYTFAWSSNKMTNGCHVGVVALPEVCT